MSRFGRYLNQSGDDFNLPCRFQMLSCLARRKQDATITFQVSISLTNLSSEEKIRERSLSSLLLAVN